MKIFRDQLGHLLILVFMLICISLLVKSDIEFLSGELLGLNTSFWFKAGLHSAIVHQIYVLIAWRAELYYKSFTRSFGEKGFKIFQVPFAILILSRPVTIFILALANADTIQLGKPLAYTISLLLFIPAFYLFYSVKKYFGPDRAFGIDHFHPEKYKDVPPVKQGIFKYTSNGMYIYGFFLLWIPGFLFQSKAALLVALFQHLYIWVHYYFVEKPDMNEIYGSKEAA